MSRTVIGQTSSETRPSSPLRLAIWAAADKGLQMLYGVALILIPLTLFSDDQWGVWTVFQIIFLSISLLGDFFILQPMVKLCSEEHSPSRPIITASLLLYLAFTLGIAFTITATPESIAGVLKSPTAIPAFRTTGILMVSTALRNIAIRILQVDYRIVAIFTVDLAYFGGVIALMIAGAVAGTLTDVMVLIDYNLIAFIASSVVGVAFTFRELVPDVTGLKRSMRRVLNLGLHQGGTGLLTVIQQQGDAGIVTLVRGHIAAGVFNAAKIFYRFFESIRDAAQLLLVPATSRAHSQERIEAVEEVAEIATAALVVLIIPLSLLLIVFAGVVVPIVLPTKIEAIPVFRWLMASGFAAPFVIVPSAILLGIGHTRDLFRGTLLGTTVLVVSGVVLTYFFYEVGMAIGVFLGTTVTAAFLTQRMNRYIPFTLRSVIQRSRSFGPIVRKRIAAMQIPLRSAPAPVPADGTGNDAEPGSQTASSTEKRGSERP
jgi:O-antigen/teichoic acid export membrane protein